MGEPHGGVIGHITPWSSSCCNFLFTLFSSITYFLYILLFGNGEFGNSWISCSTSLLSGIPLGSRNTPMYAYNNSSTEYICSLVHPSMDSFALIHSFTN